jgi:hypothetical protein
LQAGRNTGLAQKLGVEAALPSITTGDAFRRFIISLFRRKEIIEF